MVGEAHQVLLELEEQLKNMRKSVLDARNSGFEKGGALEINIGTTVDSLTSVVKKAFADSSDASTRKIGLVLLQLTKEIEDYEAQGHMDEAAVEAGAELTEEQEDAMMKSIHKKTASLTAQFDKIADSLADPDGPIQSFEQKNAAMMTLLKTAYTNFTHSKKAWKVENSRLRDELLEKTNEGISKLNEQTRERLAVTMDRVAKYLSENSELIAGMEGKADHELTEKERMVKNLLATAQKAEQAFAGEEAALEGRLADDAAAKGALGSAEAATAALRRASARRLFLPARRTGNEI